RQEPFLETSATKSLQHNSRPALTPAPQVGFQSAQPPPQQVNPLGLQPAGRTLKEVRVPSSKINTGGFKPDARFDQPRDLAQTGAEIIVRIDCVVLRVVRFASQRFDSAEQI